MTMMPQASGVFEPRTLRNVSGLGRQCLPGHLPGSASDQDRKPRLQELAELFWTHSGGPKDWAQSASIQRPMVRHNHLREWGIAPQDHVASHLPDEAEP